MTPIQAKTFMSEAYEQVRHMHHTAINIPVHDILGEFYKGWDELTDRFVETYSGAYEDIHGSMLFSVSENVDPIGYIRSIKEFCVEAQEMCLQDPDLLNILADMIELCNHTVHLLKRAY